MITYDEFKKVEIRAGKILSAEKIPETDKLLKLVVDFAEKDEAGIAKPRQIVSGISMYFPDPAVLVGKVCMFVTNLEPRTIRGFESNGMLFAVSTPEGGFSLLEPNGSIPQGTRAA
jgi:methionine--tRNA ligase beta chain